MSSLIKFLLVGAAGVALGVIGTQIVAGSRSKLTGEGATAGAVDKGKGPTQAGGEQAPEGPRFDEVAGYDANAIAVVLSPVRCAASVLFEGLEISIDRKYSEGDVIKRFDIPLLVINSADRNVPNITADIRGYTSGEATAKVKFHYGESNEKPLDLPNLEGVFVRTLKVEAQTGFAIEISMQPPKPWTANLLVIESIDLAIEGCS